LHCGIYRFRHPQHLFGTVSPLAAKAWYCVSRKMTFRTCEIRFDEELKGKLLGKLIITHHASRAGSAAGLMCSPLFLWCSASGAWWCAHRRAQLICVRHVRPAKRRGMLAQLRDMLNCERARNICVQSVLDNHELTWGYNQVSDLGDAIVRIPTGSKTECRGLHNCRQYLLRAV